VIFEVGKKNQLFEVSKELKLGSAFKTHQFQ